MKQCRRKEKSADNNSSYLSSRVLPEEQNKMDAEDSMIPCDRCKRRNSSHLTFLKVVLLAVTTLCQFHIGSAEVIHVNDVEKYLKSLDRIGTKDDTTKDGAANVPVSLNWGIADTTALVGRMFRYHLPSDAFKGNNLKYKVTEAARDSLPSWLFFDEPQHLLQGVPGPKDLGQHYLEVVASDQQGGQAKDVFSIIVIGDASVAPVGSSAAPRNKNSPRVVRCKPGEPQTLVTVIVDTDFQQMLPRKRVDLLNRITSHLNLATEMMKIVPVGNNKPMFDSSALVAGPGDAKVPKYPGAFVSWLVGCGKVESDHMPVLQQLEAAAANGTMAIAVENPIVGWHVTNSFFQEKPRKKRQAIRATATATMSVSPPTRLPGETITATDATKDTDMLTRDVPSMVSPSFSPGIQPTKVPDKPVMTKAPDMDVTMISPTATFIMPMTAVVSPEPEPEPKYTATEVLPSQPPVLTTKPSTKTTPMPHTKPSTKEATEVVVVTIPTPEPTDKATGPNCPNDGEQRPPIIQNPIRELKITAGNFFTHKIPRDMFFDCVDGHKLRLSLFHNRMEELTKDMWILLDSKKRKIAAMPMAADVGRHKFNLVAVNSQGLQVAEPFMIIVESASDAGQEITHELSAVIDMDYHKFMSDLQNRVDFSRKLARVFGDRTADKMTVTKISSGSVVYSWTNNSLPTDSCPVQAISDLVDRMVLANGTMNPEAVKDLKPYSFSGFAAVPKGACENDPRFPTKDTMDVMEPPVVEPEPEKPATPKVMTTTAPGDAGEQHDDEGGDEVWITTVVPAVVIVAILLIALLIACILYRKKRKGKMSLEDQHTFVNKGAPVIFPDELDEKPNDSSKPLIMDEEKAPMPPPEYQRGVSESPRSTPPSDRGNSSNDTMQYEEHELKETDENSPLYQPPPPVTASSGNKQPRPHAQPPYRNPPPYVPP